MLGFTITLCYGLSISLYQEGYYGYTYHYGENGRPYRLNRIINSNYEEQMAICAVMVFLGVAELVIGACAAVCSCVGCCCPASQPQQASIAHITWLSGRADIVIKGATSRYFASGFYAEQNYRQIEGNHKIYTWEDRKTLKM